MIELIKAYFRQRTVRAVHWKKEEEAQSILDWLGAEGLIANTLSSTQLYFRSPLGFSATVRLGEWIVKDGNDFTPYPDEKFRERFQRVKASSACKEKGSSFERDSCEYLSLWLTEGKSAKGLERIQRGTGLTGDIKSAHPDTFEFASKFLVECKAYEDLCIPDLLLKDGKHNLLRDFILKAEGEAIALKKEWIIFAKQDNFPIFVLMPAKLFDYYSQEPSEGGMWTVKHVVERFTGCRYHLLLNNKVIMFVWNELKEINAKHFFERLNLVVNDRPSS
jgi:hypothetical protein